MKKFVFLLAGLLCVFASCSDGGSDAPSTPTPTPEETASITLDATSLTFDATGGEKSFTFSTNKDWTLSVASTTSGNTWCTVSATSGTKGDATVKFTTTENTDYDDRSVSVTIKAGTASKSFTVTQKSAEGLLVTTKKYEIAQEGGSIEVEVKANINYQLEISETAKSWITEAKSRALTSKKHAFSIALNEKAEKREGEIYIKSDDKVETVKVYQAGGPIILLSKNEYTVSDAGETISVDINSNVEFGVQLPDVDWITDVASARGMSSHTLQYTIAANEGYDSRSAEIIFYDKNSNLKDTLKVVQAQKSAILLSEKEIKVKREGETIEVKLSANVDFEVAMPEVDWISQVTARGLTEHTLYYKVAENMEENERSAEIVFTNKNSQINESIVIKQDGKLKAGYANGVVTVVEAGTMRELLGDDLLNITSLKVVGYINTDDMACLREMLGSTQCVQYKQGILATLDLSEVISGIKVIFLSSCKNLKNIILPSDITSIDFKYCSSLTSINLPDGVTEIPSNAFEGCSSLTSVILPDGVVKIGAKAFADCSSLEFINIPNGITEISSSVFSGCSSLKSINIPNSVTSISHFAFNGCSSLTSIIIPDTTVYIGLDAFRDCSSLTSIIIPDNIAGIGHRTFAGCSSLISVIIGKGVNYILEYAFSRCDSLKEVHCLAVNPPDIQNYSTFGKICNVATLYVPKGSLAAYQEAEYWNEFNNIVEE